MDVAEPRVAEIDAKECVWCSDVARLTVRRWMNEEQVWRFVCALQISLIEVPLALQLEWSDASPALVEMKVSA